jgi:hypothetical protein
MEAAFINIHQALQTHYVALVNRFKRNLFYLID